MKTKTGFSLIFLFSLLMAGCAPPKATFEISASPDPLRYGGRCSAPVLTFTVTGPGNGLRINSIIVGYQLFDGSGKKLQETTLSLLPVPDAPSVTYDGSRIIVIPEETILAFGEGHIDFAATVYAKILSPSLTGPDETYYFTSTRSIKVLPCLPLILIPPDVLPTPTPTLILIPLPIHTPTLFLIPLPTKRPKPDSGGDPPPPATPPPAAPPPAAPPACSAEPNNPNCVP